MQILVTAGNTAVPIDRVRQITNIFTGRTGGAIARHAHARGHAVTLLTSHPEAVPGPPPDDDPRWRLIRYRTFDELNGAMEAAIRMEAPDAVIHSAAVSDFLVAGVYVPAPGTRAEPLDPRSRLQAPGSTFSRSNVEPGAWSLERPELVWMTEGDSPPRLVDAAAGKVKSDAPEVWLRLARAPKIIDRIREEWGFGGVLVKFKLEVAIAEAELLEIAEASRRHSRADLMVANTLETAREWAYLGPLTDGYRRIPRAELPEQLLNAVVLLARGAA
jgi:phosphopantothenoylcysteine synthetase/decarboxylase